MDGTWKLLLWSKDYYGLDWSAAQAVVRERERERIDSSFKNESRKRGGGPDPKIVQS